MCTRRQPLRFHSLRRGSLSSGVDHLSRTARAPQLPMERLKTRPSIIILGVLLAAVFGMTHVSAQPAQEEEPKPRFSIKSIQLNSPVLETASTLRVALNCPEGEWQSGTDASTAVCQHCGQDMTSPANSVSEEACVCNTGFVMFEQLETQYNAANAFCISCGENRVAAPSGYASASPTALENCKCNAGYAGSDGFHEDHSVAAYSVYLDCTACPIGTYKAENGYLHLFPACFSSHNAVSVVSLVSKAA